MGGGVGRAEEAARDGGRVGYEEAVRGLWTDGTLLEGGAGGSGWTVEVVEVAGEGVWGVSVSLDGTRTSGMFSVAYEK